MPDRSKHPRDRSTRRGPDEVEEPAFRVNDRRHAYLDGEGAEDEETPDAGADGSGDEQTPDPNLQRAEAAEAKLREFMEAFRAHQLETEKTRERLDRDVERRVDLQFGDLLAGLLSTIDDLDLALEHTRDVPEAAALAEGVDLARTRFLNALQGLGVERVSPEGEPFDPNVAEALRVDPVDSEEQDGRVTVTLQPGYRFKDRVLRAARVAVGRFAGADGGGAPAPPDGQRPVSPRDRT